jgi:hypothetical protein
MNKHLIAVKNILDKKKAGVSAKLLQAGITAEQKTKLDEVMNEINGQLSELEAAAEDATSDQLSAIFSNAVQKLSELSEQSMEAAKADVAAMVAKLQAQILKGGEKGKKFSAKLSLKMLSKSTEAKDSDGFRHYSAGVNVEAYTPEAEIETVEAFRPMIGVAGALETGTVSQREVKIRTFGKTGGAFAVVVKHGAAPVLTMQGDESIVEVQKYMGVVENIAVEDFEDNSSLESEVIAVANEDLAQVENDAAIVLLKGAAGAYANVNFGTKVGADEKTALLAIVDAVKQKLGRRLSTICLALNSSQWALLGDLRNSNGTPIPIDSVLGSIEKVEDNTLVGDEFICWAKKFAKNKIFKGKTQEWYRGINVTKDGANVTAVYSEYRTDEKSLAVRVRQLMYITDSSVFFKGTISGVKTAITTPIN